MTLKSIEQTWNRLNDAASAATHRFDTTALRDADENPWTDDDRVNQQRMLQEMASRVVRIEERQQVLYWLLHGMRQSLDTVPWLVAVAVIAAAVAHWL